MEDIKLPNGILFENVTIYSKSDKIRNKGKFTSTINGLKITLGNDDRDKEGVYFECKAIGIRRKFFINKDLPLEIAAENVLKQIKEHLKLIIQIL